MSILGGSPQQGPILGRGYNPIRMTTARMAGQGQSPVMAGMASQMNYGQPEYGSDEWALQYGGPGALFFRQMARGMSQSDNPLDILDPGKAHKMWSPETIGILGDRFQDAYKKKAK